MAVAFEEEFIIEISLIRHAKTAGNLDHKYIGSTDEPLSPAGIAELLLYQRAGLFKEIDGLYCSPLLRARETGRLLYPCRRPVLIDDLKECDFGLLENKSHDELKDDPAYLAWLGNNNTNDRFPGGETISAFKERSYKGYLQALTSAITKKEERIAIIAHGGTIMAVMEKVSAEPGSFYQWQAANGLGFVLEISPHNNENTLLKISKLGI